MNFCFLNDIFIKKRFLFDEGFLLDAFVFPK